MIVAVIPALDEDPGQLAQLADALHEHVDQVVIVDDSATHPHVPSAVILAGAGSLGASLHRALTYAAGWAPDRVVVIDAGGSHDPASVPHLLDHHADLVIGSRLVHGGDHLGRPSRLAATWLCGRAFAAITRRPIRDWTSGFRAYGPRALAVVTSRPQRCTRHPWQVEVLLEALAAGCSVVEEPIIYTPSASTLNRRAIREAVHLWWRTLWR